jgi:hypothetical protein
MGRKKLEKLMKSVFDHANIIEKIDKFRTKKLWLDGEIQISDIWDIYNELRKIKNAGGTTLPKILHYLAPDYFLPSDLKIRNILGLSDSASGYFRFLKLVQNKMKEKHFSEFVIETANKFDYPPLYVIDKYLWVVANNKKKEVLEDALEGTGKKWW